MVDVYIGLILPKRQISGRVCERSHVVFPNEQTWRTIRKRTGTAFILMSSAIILQQFIVKLNSLYMLMTAL